MSGTLRTTRRVHNRLPWERRRRRRSDNRQRVSASHVLPKATRLVSRSLPLQLHAAPTLLLSPQIDRLLRTMRWWTLAAGPSAPPLTDTFMALSFERLTFELGFIEIYYVYLTMSSFIGLVGSILSKISRLYNVTCDNFWYYLSPIWCTLQAYWLCLVACSSYVSVNLSEEIPFLFKMKTSSYWLYQVLIIIAKQQLEILSVFPLDS